MAEELPPGAAPVRIGVIGDVHACDEALAHLVAHLGADQRVDVLCCVGDIVNGPGDPDRCSALLRGASAVTVLGNHDRWLLEGVRLFEDAHRIEDLDAATVAHLSSLPRCVEVTAADGTTIMLCHGLAENHMNAITADDYGYALEANDDLQALLRAGTTRLVLKGHRHRHAIWRIGGMTLVDAGALLVSDAPCAVVVDVDAATITPLQVADGAVVALTPQPLRN